MSTTGQGMRKYDIYKKSHKLLIKIHKMSFTLPKHEMYEEGNQIRRSSKSITSNLIEGYGLRKYRNDYIRYLYRAYASADETIEHLDILKDTGSLKDEDLYNELYNGYSELIKMIFSFITRVEKDYTTPFFINKNKIESKKSGGGVGTKN